MTHVDVVVNDWANGLQRLAGRVMSLGQDGIKVDAHDELLIGQMLQPALFDPVSKCDVKQDDGDEYLVALHRKYDDGSNFHVTDVHDESRCPFGIALELPMKLAWH